MKRSAFLQRVALGVLALPILKYLAPTTGQAVEGVTVTLPTRTITAHVGNTLTFSSLWDVPVAPSFWSGHFYYKNGTWEDGGIITTTNASKGK